MEFTHEPGRIYTTDDQGKVLAEVTFVSAGGTSDINHTFVDESLRGTSVAGKLVQAAVDQIEKEGNRVSASCSFAAAWMKRHKAD